MCAAMAALFLLATGAKAQFNVKSGDAKPTRSLSELASNQLDNPKVLMAIGTTYEQIMRAEIRPQANLVRKIAIARINNSDGSDATTQALNFTTDSAGVLISDLDSHQKQRLFEVTLRLEPLGALLTDEISFAVRLTGRQRAKLNAIWSNVATKQAKAFLNVTQHADIKNFAAGLTKLWGGENSEPTVEQVNGVVDKMIAMLPKLVAEIKARQEPFEANGNRMALRLLTPSQRSALETRRQAPAVARGI